VAESQVVKTCQKSGIKIELVEVVEIVAQTTLNYCQAPGIISNSKSIVCAGVTFPVLVRSPYGVNCRSRSGGQASKPVKQAAPASRARQVGGNYEEGEDWWVVDTSKTGETWSASTILLSRGWN